MKQKLRPCDGCLKAKSHKAGINKKGEQDTKPKEPLDVLVSDLKTMPTTGTGGAIYAGSAIDHATKYVTMTFLVKKSQWYQKYEQIIRWLKNMKGRTHKVWRSDGAKEFDSNKIKEIHDREGIEPSITPPYTPNKNPSERFWRTLIEAVGAILLTAGMSATWWVEASRYVVHCFNRTPRKGLGGKTPYWKFYGRKHHSMKLHTLFCLAYVHIQLKSKKGLQKSRPAMFIGIDDSGRYLCICLRTKELLKSDSVTFVDEIFPMGKHKHLMNYDPNTILKHIQQQNVDIQNKLKPAPEQQAKMKYGASPKDPHKLSSVGPVENEILDLVLQFNQGPMKEVEKRTPKQANKKAGNLDPPNEPVKRQELEHVTKRKGNGDKTPDSSESDEEEESDDEEVKTTEEAKEETKFGDMEVYEKYGIPRLETVEEINREILRNAPPKEPDTHTEERTKYEHDKIDNKDMYKEPVIHTKPRRYPLRNRQTTGNSIKIMEHLAQTPEKDRKQYQRQYRKDLEAIANHIMETPDKRIPDNVRQAMDTPEWPKWQEAINKEINALYRTDSLEKVTVLPAGVKAIQCRWVFKIKPMNAQEPEIYKARLVAKGFTQRFGVDYYDTFAAVAKMTSLRTLVALAAKNNSRLTKLDVSNAFLESDIDRDVYIKPPEGFPPGCLFKLKKALYGLKQSPRLFQQTLTKELLKLGFTPLQTDICIFKHPTSDTRMLVVVDDIIIEGNDENMRKKIETTLQERFKIKIFDKVEHFIGLQLEHTQDYIKLHQTDYILGLLKKFGMEGCKTAPTPASACQQGTGEPLPTNNYYRQMVGSLIYLMATRPDICSAVTNLSKHLENPTDLDLQAAKRVLRYLAGTYTMGVKYEKGVDALDLLCFSDSDWAGCQKTRKSVSGFVVFLGNSPISWKSKTQPTVALSSCEAEYVALVVAVKEILWLIQFFKEVGSPLNLPIFIFGDNTASIALAKDPVNHERTKHIDIKHHFLRQHIMEKTIQLRYVHTAKNIADLLTKATTPATFKNLSCKIVKS